MKLNEVVLLLMMSFLHTAKTINICKKNSFMALPA